MSSTPKRSDWFKKTLDMYLQCALSSLSSSIHFKSKRSR